MVDLDDALARWVARNLDNHAERLALLVEEGALLRELEELAARPDHEADAERELHLVARLAANQSDQARLLFVLDGALSPAEEDEARALADGL